MVGLKIEENDSGVFDGALDLLEERDGFLAVDEAMIVCQSHVHHRTNLHFAADSHRPEKESRGERDPSHKNSKLTNGGSLQ